MYLSIPKHDLAETFVKKKKRIISTVGNYIHYFDEIVIPSLSHGPLQLMDDLIQISMLIQNSPVTANSVTQYIIMCHEFKQRFCYLHDTFHDSSEI